MVRNKEARLVKSTFYTEKETLIILSFFLFELCDTLYVRGFSLPEKLVYEKIKEICGVIIGFRRLELGNLREDRVAF